MQLAEPRVWAKWYAFALVAKDEPSATVTTRSDTTVAQATVGFVVLIGLQFMVAWTVVHWSPMRVIVNAHPGVVLLEGKFPGGRDAGTTGGLG